MRIREWIMFMANPPIDEVAVLLAEHHGGGLPVVVDKYHLSLQEKGMSFSFSRKRGLFRCRLDSLTLRAQHNVNHAPGLRESVLVKREV